MFPVIFLRLLFYQFPTFHEMIGKRIGLRTFDLKILKELQKLVTRNPLLITNNNGIRMMNTLFTESHILLTHCQPYWVLQLFLLEAICFLELSCDHRVHRVANAALWRTFHHEGKLSPGCWWWGCTPIPHLPSPVKLHCTLQLSGQIH
jgi:hypothetical protein